MIVSHKKKIKKRCRIKYEISKLFHDFLHDSIIYTNYLIPEGKYTTAILVKEYTDFMIAIAYISRDIKDNEIYGKFIMDLHNLKVITLSDMYIIY